MDKNTISKLETNRLADIVVRLYENSTSYYASYKKESIELEKEKKNIEANNIRASIYAYKYLVEEIETAVRFETAKLKRLKPLHRSMLKFLREKYQIKNKREFLAMPRTKLIHLAKECEDWELKERPKYSTQVNLAYPGIMVYTYLNLQFELGLKELRPLRRKRKPRKVIIDKDTLTQLSNDALTELLVDLYDNCVRIHNFHSRLKQEYLDNNNLRQYEYEMNFCEGFLSAYKTISDLCSSN